MHELKNLSARITLLLIDKEPQSVASHSKPGCPTMSALEAGLLRWKATGRDWHPYVYGYFANSSQQWSAKSRSMYIERKPLGKAS
jgi:hypothetical protein